MYKPSLFSYASFCLSVLFTSSTLSMVNAASSTTCAGFPSVYKNIPTATSYVTFQSIQYNYCGVQFQSFVNELVFINYTAYALYNNNDNNNNVLSPFHTSLPSTFPVDAIPVSASYVNGSISGTYTVSATIKAITSPAGLMKEIYALKAESLNTIIFMDVNTMETLNARNGKLSRSECTWYGACINTDTSGNAVCMCLNEKSFDNYHYLSGSNCSVYAPPRYLGTETYTELYCPYPYNRTDVITYLGGSTTDFLWVCTCQNGFVKAVEGRGKFTCVAKYITLSTRQKWTSNGVLCKSGYINSQSQNTCNAYTQCKIGQCWTEDNACVCPNSNTGKCDTMQLDGTYNTIENINNNPTSKPISSSSINAGINKVYIYSMISIVCLCLFI